MKHFNLLLAAILFSAFTMAQPEGEPKQFMPKKEDINKDNFVMDFHNDLWLNGPESFKQRGYSLGFNFAFMKEYAFKKGSAFRFAWGLGFSSHNVHHNGQFTYDEEEDFTNFSTIPASTDYKKNKLSMNYVELPVEFRFRTQNDTHFRIYAGFKGGVLVNVHSKLVQEDKTIKVTGLENTEIFRYGPTFRIGLKGFSLFGFYSLSNIFEKDKGEEFLPVSAGLSFFIP